MNNLTLNLPTVDGQLSPYTLSGSGSTRNNLPGPFNRIALSAAHVVADPQSQTSPDRSCVIDWPTTISYRRHILDLGLGIAEAMDTAQRGMGLDWPNALELIRQSLTAASPEERTRIYSGVGTDHLDPADAQSVDDVIRAYMEQLEAVQGLGSRVIIMASRALARVARSAEDYRQVYARVLGACDNPAILHWLGPMFDPALQGYWGDDAFDRAMDTTLSSIDDNVSQVEGIKVSLLDDDKEILMRRKLPSSVKMYTGDDFNYPSLIKGDEQGFSHALLGIFDAIAPVAANALSALGRGDEETYDRLLAPTVPLSRLIFQAPTQHYKTGVVFLAWLNGFQDHFVMIGGSQSMRPLSYFTDLLKLADTANLLRDPALAASRMREFMALYGIRD